MPAPWRLSEAAGSRESDSPCSQLGKGRAFAGQSTSLIFCWQVSPLQDLALQFKNRVFVGQSTSRKFASLWVRRFARQGCRCGSQTCPKADAKGQQLG